MKILILLLLSNAMLATENLSTRRITIDDGLSQNYIYSIVQDRMGFLWFGTKDGLNRYDGYAFTVYRRDNADTLSLSDNTVTAIHQGENDHLWIGTSAGGLLLFDQRKETFTSIDPSDHSLPTLRQQHITVIKVTKDGSVLIGTSGRGLVVYHPRTETWREFRKTDTTSNGLYSDYIADVTEDSEGKIWVAAEGLHSIDRDGRVQRIERSMTAANREQMNKITGLMSDSLGRIWVSYRNGLDIYSGGRVQRVITSTEENDYYWLGRALQDMNGFIWVTSIHHLLKIDPLTFRTEEIVAVPDERISTGFLIDRSNNVWVGTSGWGIFQYNPRTDAFGKRSGNFIAEVFAGELKLLAHKFGKKPAFDIFDAAMRGNEFKIPYRSKRHGTFFPSTDAFLFHCDPSGRISRHLLVPPETPNRKMYSPQFIAEDFEGRVWIVRNNGMLLFDGTPELFPFLPLYPDSTALPNTSGYADITAIHADRSGALWFGTPTNGLLRYHPRQKTKHWFRYRQYDTTSLSHNHVLVITEDPIEPEKYLWVGTDGGGLNRFDRSTGYFSSISEKQGFPNNTVYGILSDEQNNLWISTNKGLVKFHPREGILKVFDIHDGLQSNEFNRREFYQTENGTMYFGGVNGYNAFRASDIVDNDAVPSVVLTDIRLFNKSLSFKRDTLLLTVPIEFADTLRFDYSDNVITFEFAGLEYSATAKNQYRYILQGFTTEWIFNGVSRTATFTNIDPGEYVFRVTASNGDGIWNTEGRSLVLIIHPPFWRTWWFLSLAVLAFIATGPIIYYRRVTELKKEHERQHEVSRLLIQSQEGERKRIAQEMHDSLGQELLVIKNRALMGLKTAADETKEQRQLKQISDGATNILKLVRTMSHNLRPPELDRLGLTETIRSILSNIRDSSGKVIQAEVEEIDGLINKEDEINVVRIIQEALSNIEKHANASRIDLSIVVKQDHIAMNIKDDGIGYVPENVQPGIGHAGMSERVRILRGTLSLSSVIGEGTTLSVTIPINRTDA